MLDVDRFRFAAHVRLPAFAAEPTTSVTITKYANDGTTILDQTTVDYLWMMENCRSMATGQLIITTTAYF